MLVQFTLLLWKKKDGDGKLQREGKHLYLSEAPWDTFEGGAVMLLRSFLRSQQGDKCWGGQRLQETSPAVKFKKETGAQAQLSIIKTLG